jgi:Icc-related predicted phosphoesterase
MKIIALPDLHDGQKELPAIGPALAEVDLVLLVGDLTNDGGAGDAAKLVNAVRRFNASILAIPGNWDGPEVDGYLTRQKINLHCQLVQRSGLNLLGMGGSLSILIPTPNSIKEAEFSRYLEELAGMLEPGLPFIFVCHQPPYNTITDIALGGPHVGSKSVRTFIERTQPLICFTGHIHEGVGIDTIGRTQIINPGPLWQGGYAYAEVTSDGVEILEIRSKG